MNTTDAKRRFSRVFVLRNPVSTQAAQGEQRIAELRQFFGKTRVTIIETVPGGADANRELICRYAKDFNAKTLLCIAAGDGTVGMVIETLLSDPRIPSKARQAPVLPLWGGNANDLAHMLNGSVSRSRLHNILADGSLIEVHPLQCVLTTPDGGAPTTRLAMCYVSFGATALAAATLNGPELRKSRWLRLPGGRAIAEFLAGARALVRAPAFALQEDGDDKLVYERTFANGSRFAKIERLPLKLTEKVFLQHTIEKRQLPTVIPRLWRLLQKRRAHQFKGNYAEFIVKQPVLAQFDGEPMEIAADTHVCITLSKRPFYALSVMLSNKK
jgi:diacylglycerol kinase family enzyme